MGLAERARSQIAALTVAATPLLRQGSGVLALAGLAVAGMALLSHDPTDPSFNVAADGQAKNWLGFWGAAFADFTYQMLGHAVWFGFIPLAAAGYRVITSEPLNMAYLRCFLAVLSVMLAADTDRNAATSLARIPSGREARRLRTWACEGLRPDCPASVQRSALNTNAMRSNPSRSRTISGSESLA